MAEIFYPFDSRYIFNPVLSDGGLSGSRPALIGIGLMPLLQPAFTCFPPSRHLMGTEPINPADRMTVSLAGVATLLRVEVEVEKAVWRRWCLTARSGSQPAKGSTTPTPS